MVLQSIIIPKNKYSLSEAKQWIRDHGHKVTFYGKTVDITENFYRFRQAAPKKNVQYFIKTLPGGIKLVEYH